MSAAGLAAFQARAGAAIIRKLANAAADFGGGVVVEGKLSRPSFRMLGSSVAGMMSRDIILAVVQSDLQAVEPVRGTLLMIDSQQYRVLSSDIDLEHGVVELSLEKVQA